MRVVGGRVIAAAAAPVLMMLVEVYVVRIIAVVRALPMIGRVGGHGAIVLVGVVPMGVLGLVLVLLSLRVMMKTRAGVHVGGGGGGGVGVVTPLRNIRARASSHPICRRC